jgi:hypothetical protein
MIFMKASKYPTIPVHQLLTEIFQKGTSVQDDLTGKDMPKNQGGA